MKVATALFTGIFILHLCLADKDMTCENKDNVKKSDAECFDTLVEAINNSSWNRINLTTAFFPSDKEAAIFVIVRYVIKGSSEPKVWFWSESTYHLYQPAKILQFTSLFFTEPAARNTDLYLTLPVYCSQKMMQLLTQRLRLLAERGSLHPIRAVYQPKAENEDTLRCYFRRNEHTFRISFSMQLVLYFVAILVSPLLIIYLLYGHPFEYGRKIIQLIKEPSNNRNEPPDYRWWEVRMLLHFIAISSITMWFYALLVTVIGLCYQQIRLPKELTMIHHREHEGFNLMYGLTPLMLVENGLTPFISFLLYLGLLVVISYKCKKFHNNSSHNTEGINAAEDSSTHTENFHFRLAEMFFLSLPITTLAVHFTHIVIGFIQNPVHATSVGLFYSFILLASVVLFKMISSVHLAGLKMSNTKKWIRHEVIFFIIFTPLLIVMLLLFGYIASLYFLLPINRAIDIAPTAINGFVSTVTLVFAGYLTYYFIKKKKKN